MKSSLIAIGLPRRCQRRLFLLIFFCAFQPLVYAAAANTNLAAEKTSHRNEASATNNGAVHRPVASISNKQFPSEQGQGGLLEPRALPYALSAGKGKVKVRFSVALAGGITPTEAVYLRRVGDPKDIKLNDQGKGGDLLAKDGIYGANVWFDTSGIKPDTCVQYEAYTHFAKVRITSPAMKLCVSSFPVRVAASDTRHPVVLADGARAIADELLITTKPNTSAATIRTLASEINARVVGSLPPLDYYQLQLFSAVSAERLAALVAQMRAHAEVETVSVNGLGSYASADTYYSSQHGLQQVRAQDVWDMGIAGSGLATGSGVTVAVLEYGIDLTHPDLDATWTCSQSPCLDTTGHGTEVAGVIAAKTNNVIGVAGVAYGSTIRLIAMRPDPVGNPANDPTIISLGQMTNSFLDAGAYGLASVINASFSSDAWTSGAFFQIKPLCAAIQSAVMSGTTPRAVVVNAAGNHLQSTPYDPAKFYYPAACNISNPVSPAPPANSDADAQNALTAKNLLITVANSSSMAGTISDPNCSGSPVAVLNNQLYACSNYGAWVDIAAPGVQIYTTTLGHAYATPSGTSFAAPVVAGAAAILKSCGVPLAQIESTLQSSATVTVTFPNASSAKRLDIYLALKQFGSPTGVTISPNNVDENINTTLGYEIGTLSASHAGTCNTFTYGSTLGGADGALFNIVGDKLRLNAGVLVNYEDPARPSHTYNLTVHVTDYFGTLGDYPVTVAVNDKNDPPTWLTQPGSVSYVDTPANDVFTIASGVLHGVDEDAGAILTYGISGGSVSLGVSTLTGIYGTLAVNTSSGAYTFTPNNSAIQAIKTNASDNFTVTVSDGIAPAVAATYTVNIIGANDTTDFSGGINAALSEDVTLSGSGTLVVSDRDTGDAAITPQSNTVGTYGVFNIASNGAWTYTLNNTNANVQALNAGQNVTDTFIVATAGGATQTITMTITGTNDAPTLATPTSPPPYVDTPANDIFSLATGTLYGADVDAGTILTYGISGGSVSLGVSTLAGIYGTLAVNTSSGAYTFTPNNSAIQALTTTNPTESYTVTVSDGLAPPVSSTLTISFSGANDTPIGTPTISGQRVTGQTLTASVSGITDADCPGVITSGACTGLSYQWRRDGLDISGETASTYNQTAADKNSTVSVCVKYTDGAGLLNPALCSVNDAMTLGDPHITTVDGLHYDFQSAGEFVALRDSNGMEIQVRHIPVSTAVAITDNYSGLTSGVSINTAVAARVGNHRVTYQQSSNGNSAASGYQLRVDGTPTTLVADGLVLVAGGRVAAFPAGGIQVDFPDGTLMVATPNWWAGNNVWYLNVQIFHTSAYQGIMGARSQGSWLPRLANGTALGAMPVDLHDRYVELYEKFANSWRVNAKSTLFDYAPDTSIQTFALATWPQEKPPYIVPNSTPTAPVAHRLAQQLCRGVVGKNSNADCVFDVMVTGHSGFAKSHLLSQKILIGSTAILVRTETAKENLVYIATVSRNSSIALKEFGVRATPAGAVQFTLQGEKLGVPIKLDARGQARWIVPRQKVADRQVGARYLPTKGSVFLPSSSVAKSEAIFLSK